MSARKGGDATSQRAPDFANSANSANPDPRNRTRNEGGDVVAHGGDVASVSWGRSVL